MNHRLKIIKKVHSIKRVKNLCVQCGEKKINICNYFNIYMYGKEQKYTKINSKYLIVGLSIMGFLLSSYYFSLKILPNTHNEVISIWF